MVDLASSWNNSERVNCNVSGNLGPFFLATNRTFCCNRCRATACGRITCVGNLPNLVAAVLVDAISNSYSSLRGLILYGVHRCFSAHYKFWHESRHQDVFGSISFQFRFYVMRLAKLGRKAAKLARSGKSG